MKRLFLRAFGVLAALACVAGLLALAAETAAYAQTIPQASLDATS